MSGLISIHACYHLSPLDFSLSLSRVSISLWVYNFTTEPGQLTLEEPQNNLTQMKEMSF